MALWRQLARGLRVLVNRSAADRDVDDEVQHYLDEATRDYVGRGLTAEQARRAARRDLGSAVSVREEVRQYGWEQLPGTFLADLRFGGRMLRKSPVFTAVVVLV